MSNEFDDLDMELEIELDDSDSAVEIDHGFELKRSSTLYFIEEDELEIDEVAMMATSGAYIQIEAPQKEEQLIIGTASADDLEVELDIDLGEVTEQKYELALTPAQHAVSLYQPKEDEAFYVEISNKEIHDVINNVEQYAKDAFTKIRNYLDSATFDFIPKSGKFKSNEFKGQQDFRSMLVSEFMNHRSIPEEYTADHIVAKMFRVYEAEKYPEMNERESRHFEELIRKFITFANTTYDEAQRATDLVAYKEFPKTLRCPEVVGNFVYVCGCGKEYPMPEGRPTMTFLIREVSKSPQVTFMNHQIPCKTCNVYLALPSTLVDVLNVNMQDYINRVKATYEQPRIYRPKIEDLEQIIPSDVRDLFQLREQTVGEAKSAAERDYNSAFLGYRKLINLWMSAVETAHELEIVSTELKTSREVRVIANEMARVDFGFVADLYSYQFTKTILHYLEGASLFALTKERKVFYDYCEIEGYNRKAFPADYAKEWIMDNASFIASLNNLYEGDTKMVDLGILPEYVDCINYVVGLHLLSKPELLNPQSELAKWSKKANSSLKGIDKIIEKLEPHPKHIISFSPRELLNTKKIYDILCWSDAYNFLKFVVAPKRYTVEMDSNLKSLSVSALRKSEEDFYGQAISDRIVIRPTLFFDEFMQAFKEFGHYLFTGVIVDEPRKNLAKGIELFRRANMLGKVFEANDQPLTNVRNILIEPSEYTEEDEKKLLFELVIKSGDLPGELNEIRDNIGYKEILNNLDEYKDQLYTNSEFMRKYGEALECY